MWIKNKEIPGESRNGTGNATTVCLLSLLLVIGCTDALKSSVDIKLPAVRPVLNVVDTAESQVSSDLEQLIETKLSESVNGTGNPSDELLSRKRRYLVFPEGSSFQMVYDEIICVVDYTNYLVLGITVALAWELPSKPPSEALEDLLVKLEDGTLDISRNDTASNITYVDNETTNQTNYKPNFINLSNGGAGGSNSYYSSSPVFRTPMHPSHQLENSYYRRPSPPARRKDSYYYSHKGNSWSSQRNPFEQWSRPQSPAQNTRYPYWALASHLKNSLRQRNGYYSAGNSMRPKNSYYAQPKRKPQQKIRYQARHHQIYPVFGKRSIPDRENPHHRQRRSGISTPHDDQLSRLESHQIQYHRDSRQTLYGRIEKYLNQRGQNGHQCVLRTLCETGQKSSDREPGSFVGELLRAIFTIPEALEREQVAARHTHYDTAHAHTGNCAALYPECEQSIWDAPFIQ